MLEDCTYPCNHSYILLHLGAAICVRAEPRSGGRAPLRYEPLMKGTFFLWRPKRFQSWWNSGTTRVLIGSLFVCFLFIRSFPPLKVSVGN